MSRSELFNVGGDKLAVLEKVLKKEKKRLQLHDTPPERIKRSFIRTQEELKRRRQDYLQTRLYHSSMRNASKFAIIGDEHRMRNELVLGFAVNSRDHTVTLSRYAHKYFAEVVLILDSRAEASSMRRWHRSTSVWSEYYVPSLVQMRISPL